MPAASLVQLAARLSEVAAAVQRQDGVALAALLAVDAPRPTAAVTNALRLHASLVDDMIASQRLPPPYEEARQSGCFAPSRSCVSAHCTPLTRRGCR
jgi:hypothetical protein